MVLQARASMPSFKIIEGKKSPEKIYYAVGSTGQSKVRKSHLIQCMLLKYIKTRTLSFQDGLKIVTQYGTPTVTLLREPLFR